MLTGNTTDEPPRRRLAPPRVRPNKYHEEGQGRKTGWRPPPNLPKDEFGFENFDDYLRSDEEEAHDEVAAGPFMPYDDEVVQDSRPASPELHASPGRNLDLPTRQTPQHNDQNQYSTSGRKSLSHHSPRHYNGSPVHVHEDPSAVFRKSTLVPRSPVSASQDSPVDEEFEEERASRPRATARRHSEVPAVSKSYRQQLQQQQQLNHRRETMAPRVVYQDRYYDDNSSRYPDNKYFDQQAQEYEDEPLDLEDLDSRRRQQYPQPRGPHDQRQLVVSSRSRTSTPNSRTAQQYSPNHRVESPILRQTVHSQPRSQQPRYLPRYEEPAEEYSYEDDNSDANVHRASPVNGGKYPQPFARAVSAAAASATRQLPPDNRRKSLGTSTAPTTPAMNAQHPKKHAEAARGPMTEQPARRHQDALQKEGPRPIPPRPKKQPQHEPEPELEQEEVPRLPAPPSSQRRQRKEPVESEVVTEEMRQATASVARDSPKRVIKKSGATAVVASESPRSASSTSAAVGRHGRSKLSERVVTVADETSHDEAEMEQEDYPEDTAQPQDDEEEEDEGSAQKAAASGERYVAFSESKHPDWSYPLLPGELGYVAPVAKSSPAVRSSGGLASRTASVTTGTAARKGKARAPIQFLTDDNASMEGPAADEPEDDVSRDMVSAEQDEEEEDVGYNGDMDHNTAPDEFEEHNDQEVEDAIEEEEVNQPDEGTQENEEVVEVVEAKKGRGRPPTSKKRDRDSTEKSTVRASKKPKKEEGALVVAENNGSRGKRIRLEPVDFWKGEQVKYNMRRDSLGSGTLVPVATAVLKAPPSEEHETKPVHRKKSLSKGALPIKKEKVPVLKTPDLPVLNFETGEEVTERVVLTEEMYNPQVVGQGSTFMFQRTFSVGSFCGSGIMILPKGSEKPKKSSGPTVLIVYVISGKVRVTLHKSSFEVTEGSQFMIPRGNFYSMKNTGSSDVRLFFLQAKESEMTEQAQAAAPSEPPKAPIDPKDADSDDTAKPKKSRSSKAASDAPATKKAGTSTDVPKTKKSDKDAKESSEGISSKAKGKQRAKK